MKQGRFITFEGGEGVGKTTQIQKLARRLQDLGYEVEVTREPGGVPFAEEIRTLVLKVAGEGGTGDPLTESLMFYAARREHLNQKIIPALQAGKIVLCDRFSDSTFVYQHYVKGVGVDILLQLDKWVVGNHQPHLTLVLDVPAEEAYARRKARYGLNDKFEAEGIEFHKKIQEGFLDLAKVEGKTEMKIINAFGDIDEIATRIWQQVEPILK